MNSVNITLDICGLIVTIVSLLGLYVTKKYLNRKRRMPGVIGFVAFFGVAFDLLSYAGFWRDSVRYFIIFLCFISILAWTGTIAVFIIRDIKSAKAGTRGLEVFIRVLFFVTLALYIWTFATGRLFSTNGGNYYPGDGLLYVTVANIVLFITLLAICIINRKCIDYYAIRVYIVCLITPMLAVCIDLIIPGISTAYFLCDLCALECFFVLFGLEMAEGNRRLSETLDSQDKQLGEINSLNEQLSVVNKDLAAAKGMIEGLTQEYHTIFLVGKQKLKIRLIRTSGVSTIKDAIKRGLELENYDPAMADYIATYVVPEDRERMSREVSSQTVMQRLSEMTLYTVNYRRRDSEGNIAYHQVAFTNADSEDGKKRFVYAFRDIDALLKEEQKTRQELMEARLAAEAANEAKTVFLNNLSHDIRTPMNAILGFTQLMKKDVGNPETISQYIEKIEKSGDYLLTIINNVLELARIDSGKEIVDDSFTDLCDENCSVVPLLENELRRKNITFSSEMDITHRHVFADMAKIREITMNLMSNAIKYTPEGGEIKLRFEEIPCDKPGYATFVNSVSDNGIGMSEEFRQIIFDAFSRERSTTESKIMGTGLGMSIVKKLVDMMGGRIQVDSELGKGTTFMVILNHKIVEAPDEFISEQQKKAAKTKLHFDGQRILLAEDNELNAEIAIAILEDAGFSVEHATDGVVCLDMYAKAAPGYYDLILTDIQMPNLNGYQVTDQIRMMSDPVKAGIPIVAMTANAFEEDRQAALDAGMNGHVAKPINVTKMLETLSELL